MVNEGLDGSVQWLSNENIEFIHHKENVGICTGLNSATHLIKQDFVVYLNDDMVVLPQWDYALANEIASIGHRNFMLSGTMIEPYETGNRCAIVQDFGTDIESFAEEGVLAFNDTFKKEDWSGSSWPPVLIPTHIMAKSWRHE